jgi:hypothetical protein
MPGGRVRGTPVVSDLQVRDDSRVNRVVTVVLAAAGLALGVLAYRVQTENPLAQTTVLRAGASASPPGRSSSPASSPGGVARATGSARSCS